MKKNIILSVLAGLLLWAAWPPAVNTTFLLFVGLVPMLILMEQIINSVATNKGKQIFWITFIGFFIWNTLSIYWVYNSLKIIGPVTALLVSLIPFSLGPFLMAGACCLYYHFRRATNQIIGLAGLVCLWIAYEYLHQSWDLAFPWMTLGNGFAVNHQWIQWYDATGVYGGTVWIWAVNIVFFLLYLSITQKKSLLRSALLGTTAIACIAAPLYYSFSSYKHFVENNDPSDVVIVQPDVDPYTDLSLIPICSQISTLSHLSDSVAQRNTEFFIWPESAIPQLVDEDNFRSTGIYTQLQQFLTKYKNGNVLTGIESSKIYNTDRTPSANPIPNSSQYYDVFNAAVNVENSASLQFYHKSKLVPGVEQLPFGSLLTFTKPLFAHFGGATGSFGKQAEPSVFYSQEGIGVAPVICYESIWGEYVATYVHKGAQFIAIITNDGWWENTSGKDQHLLYAKLRAIETRRWVCRSANTGISAFINERGDIVKQSKWWAKTALKQDINLNSDLTFYVLHGDYIPKTASTFALIIILFIVLTQINSKYKILKIKRAAVKG